MMFLILLPEFALSIKFNELGMGQRYISCVTLFVISQSESEFYFANAGIAASIACDFLTDLVFFGLLIMQTNVTNQIIRARTY